MDCLDQYKDNFEVKTHSDALREPFSWKKSKIVFVNSMSDLFHEQIHLSFIQRVFDVMRENPQHVFQVLTKRANRLLELNNDLKWSHNIWMGVSIEDQSVLDRIDQLRKTTARVKFIYMEPLIGPLSNLNLDKIDWIIVGGESGNNPRPMESEWVLDIQEQCQDKDVAFFFKQWGGKNKKKNGRTLNGKTYDEMPEIELQLSI